MSECQVKRLFNIVCVTFLLLDSGGGLGLRVISFSIIFLFAINSLLGVSTINKALILLYVMLIISILNTSVATNSILVWTFSYLLIPVFALYINGSSLNNDVFVISGTIFSIVIIIIFLGRLTGNPIINGVNDYIVNHSDGFFGDKSFISGDILPNVYFQGTLSLVICGALSLEKKRYICYTLIVVALILAPSRFGFLVLIFWGLIIFFLKSNKPLIYLPIIVICTAITLFFLPFGTELIGIFNGKSDGIEIRNGHIQSVFNEFFFQPFYILTGEGPGSIFYSIGYRDYVDNIELSQFEYLRKYGLPSTIIFILFYFWPLVAKNKESFFIKGALIMYYIVSFSNPVLSSIFSMLFLTHAYKKSFSNG
jgi:hypothetical protein